MSEQPNKSRHGRFTLGPGDVLMLSSDGAISEEQAAAIRRQAPQGVDVMVLPAGLVPVGVGSIDSSPSCGELPERDDLEIGTMAECDLGELPEPIEQAPVDYDRTDMRQRFRLALRLLREIDDVLNSELTNDEGIARIEELVREAAPEVRIWPLRRYREVVERVVDQMPAIASIALSAEPPQLVEIGPDGTPDPGRWELVKPNMGATLSTKDSAGRWHHYRRRKAENLPDYVSTGTGEAEEVRGVVEPVAEVTLPRWQVLAMALGDADNPIPDISRSTEADALLRERQVDPEERITLRLETKERDA